MKRTIKLLLPLLLMIPLASSCQKQKQYDKYNLSEEYETHAIFSIREGESFCFDAVNHLYEQGISDENGKMDLFCKADQIKASGDNIKGLKFELGNSYGIYKVTCLKKYSGSAKINSITLINSSSQYEFLIPTDITINFNSSDLNDEFPLPGNYGTILSNADKNPYLTGDGWGLANGCILYFIGQKYIDKVGSISLDSVSSDDDPYIDIDKVDIAIITYEIAVATSNCMNYTELDKKYLKEIGENIDMSVSPDDAEIKGIMIAMHYNPLAEIKSRNGGGTLKLDFTINGQKYNIYRSVYYYLYD